MISQNDEISVNGTTIRRVSMGAVNMRTTSSSSGGGTSVDAYSKAESDAKYVAKETGKGLSSNDFTNADKAKLDSAITSHQDISGKVDVEEGKGLSSNDYTDADKTAVGNIAELYRNQGTLASLTTTAKTDLVSAINEVNAKPSGGYTKPTDGIPLSDLASGVQTSLGKADSALQSHQQLKTINNQPIVGSGNITIEGGGSSDFKLIKTINITEPVCLVEQELDGEYNELFVLSDNAILVVDSEGNGKQDLIGIIPNDYKNSYMYRVAITSTNSGNYSRRIYAHIIAINDTLIAYSNTTQTGENVGALYFGRTVYDSSLKKISKIKIMPKTSTNYLNINTIYIYSR